jgi:hypothetical protein
LDDLGSIPGRGKKLSVLHSVQTGSAAHSGSYPRGRVGFSPGGNRPGREADHLRSSNAEVENGGAVSPLPRSSS